MRYTIRAPLIHTRRAEKGQPRRTADVHWHPRKFKSEDDPLCYSAADAIVTARRSTSNGRALLEISAVATVDGGNGRRCGVPDLNCPTLMALGALAEVELDVEDEMTSPEGNFSNDELVECPKCEGETTDCDLCDDERKVRCDVADVWEIRRRVQGGDVWAWFTVRVRATVGGHVGTSGYVGCCSYRDRRDFETNSTYDDLRTEALRDLARVLGFENWERLT